MKTFNKPRMKAPADDPGAYVAIVHYEGEGYWRAMVLGHSAIVHEDDLEEVPKLPDGRYHPPGTNPGTALSQFSVRLKVPALRAAKERLDLAWREVVSHGGGLVFRDDHPAALEWREAYASWMRARAAEGDEYALKLGYKR